MVGDIRTDRAIGMGNSIHMMMKCKSQWGKKEANEQEIGKFFVHQPIKIRVIIYKKKMENDDFHYKVSRLPQSIRSS
jgi:hypothetical protein